MNSSSGTGENVEIGTATAPVIGAPSSAATASGRLPIKHADAGAFAEPGRDQGLGDPPCLVRRSA